MNITIKPYTQEEKKLVAEKFEALFDELVPDMGACESVSGEIVRAVARIRYRYYNDGDVANCGYGMETVLPSVSYLIDMPDVPADKRYEAANVSALSDLSDMARKLIDFSEDAYYGSYCENNYENAIYALMDFVTGKMDLTVFSSLPVMPEGCISYRYSECLERESEWERDEYPEDEYEDEYPEDEFDM